MMNLRVVFRLAIKDKAPLNRFRRALMNVVLGIPNRRISECRQTAETQLKLMMIAYEINTEGADS
jgi:hypothetical protein